jgi:hypothetical protein
MRVGPGEEQEVFGNGNIMRLISGSGEIEEGGDVR